MNPGAKVLIVGHDYLLLETRRQVLLAVAQVESYTPAEAPKIIEGSSLALLILCHTLTGEERRELTDVARHAHHPPKILGLCSPRTGDLGHDVDISLPIGYRPENLLTATTTLLADHLIGG